MNIDPNKSNALSTASDRVRGSDNVRSAGALEPRVVDGVSNLAFRLYERLAKPGQSFFVSPASIGYAMALLANGAEGDQRQQMLAGLGLPVVQAQEMDRSWE